MRISSRLYMDAPSRLSIRKTENEIEVVCEIIYGIANLPGETQSFTNIEILYTRLNSIIEMQKQISQQQSYQMDDDYKVLSFYNNNNIKLVPVDTFHY